MNNDELPTFPKFNVMLPDGDDRIVKVVWTGRKTDGSLDVCIRIDPNNIEDDANSPILAASKQVNAALFDIVTDTLKTLQSQIIGTEPVSLQAINQNILAKLTKMHLIQRKIL